MKQAQRLRERERERERERQKENITIREGNTNGYAGVDEGQKQRATGEESQRM